MCLDTVAKKLRKNTKTVVAFKIFRVEGRRLVAPFNGIKSLRAGLWLSASTKTLKADKQAKTYPSGFHAMKTADEALVFVKTAPTFDSSHYVIIPVTLRSVRTEGKQWGAACLVADQMMVDRFIATKAIYSSKALEQTYDGILTFNEHGELRLDAKRVSQ